MTPAAEPGRVLGGRYHLVSLIARGGMASVWVGDDTLLARRVAIKTLRPELADDEVIRARFRHEAIAVASLTHPNIVATYDTGEDEGIAYLVMELIDGPNLRRHLDERGPLPVPEAVSITRGVAAALAHAHSKGIVHRDIKPANVLVPPTGSAKVTDFGIAKVAGGVDLTATGSVMGTARYLAPEQVRGEPADGRADLYAVGLLLYEMLAGRTPFTGDTDTAVALARLASPPAPVRSHRGDVPSDLDTIVLRCLALDPEHRYPDADALGAVLGRVERAEAGEAAAAGPSPVATTAATAAAPARATPPGPPRRDRGQPGPRRSGWPWALLGVLLLAIGSAAGYLVVSTTRDSGGSGGGSSASAPRVVGATDFDPEGGDGENGDLAGFAVDGDPATSWRTETYRSPVFGGGKSGVGLAVELAGDGDVSSVEVDTTSSGWSARVYVGDGAATTLDGWGPALASGNELGSSARFRIDPPARGSAVLLWLTRLPGSGRLEIAEVRVG
ncbi:MAG: protein kinase [Acidimicrobiia bacterium]